MKTKAQEPLNTEEQMAFATMAALADIDLKKVAIKVAIGYAFFVVGYIAAEHAAVSLAVLVSPVWLQLVICFAVLALGLVAIVTVTPAVTNTIYDGAAWAVNKVRSVKLPKFNVPFTVH